ncbi:UNVERIFIED_CONTAM: Large ribosomal RNA subunit accumulation protein YCED2, chloroplastic [Sesamum radiatum]|uniref:Large ribosomal RNA subunit accumulation protein YCED2, chloroplastic n=1 Tax=Sesamum radiatum TaxID=300843 RepID=A0AAW2TXY6_SESRA
MAEFGNMINRFSSVQHKLMCLPISLPRASAAAKRNQLPPMAGKKKSKARLITISPSDGRWHGKWNSDYTFSIQELQLHDLPDDVQKDTDVSVALSIQKINTTFKVWILPSTRQIRDYSSHHHQLPDIGADDPSVNLDNICHLVFISYAAVCTEFAREKLNDELNMVQVIYVKPGYEANLDPLIQDNIRLATSVEETCSESCNNTQPKLHHLGARNRASIERRWHKLLELKKNHL